MANRSDHFLKAHLYRSEIDAGHGLRDLAASEDEPGIPYEDDVRAIYAAALALSLRGAGYAPNIYQPRFEARLTNKEDRHVWGTSIMKMRKAALDGEVESIPERAVLLSAIVAFKEDVRAALDVDKEFDSHADMSNNAKLIYYKHEESNEMQSKDWDRPNLNLVAQGRLQRTSDEAMSVFEKMVSLEGMDQKLRRLAAEAGKASEKIVLGWGRRTLDGPLKADDHSLAQIHKEIGLKRSAMMAMAQQQGMGMGM